ncbi:hypothetical protein ABHN03_13635 [Paenibacillus sp. NRS-1775]
MAQISATVKTIPHPDPQRLVDLWARIVLKELLRREQEGNQP